MTESPPESAPPSAASPTAPASAAPWKAGALKLQGWFWRHLLVPLTQPQRMLSVGLDLPMVFLAVVATAALYSGLNWMLCRQIDQVYANLTLTEIKSNDSQTAAAERMLQITGMDKATGLAAALGDVFTPSSQQPLATAQFMNLMAKWGTVQAVSTTSSGTTTTNDSGKGARESLLRSELTGHRSGWPWWAVKADMTNGDQLIARLEQQDPVWARSLSQLDDGTDKRLFLVRFADLLARRMQPSIRELNRWNGWIQWWTVFTMFLVIGSVLRRWITLRRLKSWTLNRLARSYAHGGHLEVPRDLQEQELVAPLTAACQHPTVDQPSRLATVREQFDNLRNELDSRVYATLGFLLGVLPSLGFIGTVLGMGSALLEAEGLFSSRDKQKAISNITQQLGFAFDTTFVALLAGILAGVLVCWVRVRELQLLRTVEAGCLAQIQGHPLPAIRPVESPVSRLADQPVEDSSSIATPGIQPAAQAPRSMFKAEPGPKK